jgi:Ca2+-binding EF-hand superfamily protein
MLRFANAGEEMKQADVEEFLRVLFERTCVKSKEEERTLLGQKVMEETGQQGFVKASKFVAFCSEEADRQDWTMVNHRLKLCAQKAELEGVDVEQMLADFDTNGANYISTRKFRDFLTKLAGFGKLLQADITLCCRYFSRHSRGLEDRDSVSLAEVMAAFGKEYVGNLQARVQKMLRKNAAVDGGLVEAKYILRLLSEGKENSGGSGKGYSYEQVESALRSLGVLVDLSSNQIKSMIRKMDSNNIGRISALQVLTFLDIKFTAAEIQQAEKAPPLSARGRPLHVDTSLDEPPEIDAEFLLRLLLNKVQKNGVAVDHAFRHFDTNGDGFISRKELEEGLRELAIFDSIPQWTSQLPAIVKKFDKSGDGQVSLREFFSFLGIQDYAPNIIQRLTKIFAIATQKGLSFQDIFIELDEDKNGKLNADEIITGLKKLGTFGEVTHQDADSVVAQFDDDGDKHVSVSEFITFFSSRVKQDIEQRRQKHIEKIVLRFKEVMNVAQGKGASIADIFGHFDKDKGGAVSTQELAASLKGLPNFKSLSNQDIDDLIAAIDSDRSGEVSLMEFDHFINGENSSSAKTKSSGSIFDQVRETFAAAQARGLSFEQTFSLIDKDDDGRLTINELEKLLKKIPVFKSISAMDVKKLFDLIDSDKSGLISVNEFQDFVRLGKEDYLRHKQELQQEEEEKRKRSEALAAKRSPRGGVEDTPQFGARRGGGGGNESNAGGKTMEEKRELFLRHIRRISEIDGSVRGLLAYLDDDEDGLIQRIRFFNLLRREDVFETLSERDVDTLIEHCYSKDHEKIQLTVLLHFLENEGRMKKKGLTYLDMLDNNDSEESKQQTMVEQHYEFSRDMEIHAVEKKMRSFGRILAKKGVDVEKHFYEYDARRTGCVLRTDFIKVLSSLGMYLLEEGKVIQDGLSGLALHGGKGRRGGDEAEIKQLQIAQIKRLKGTEGTYLMNAPRLARKFHDHPSNGNVGDFKVRCKFM